MRAPSMIAFALSLCASAAHAAGFIIPEQSPIATGRAVAVVADQTDPSAVFYNPANIADQKGLHASLGANGIAPRSSFTLAATGQEFKADNLFFVAPNAYLTAQFTDLVSAGLGLSTIPFGLSVKWGRDTPARTVALRQELRTYFISPVATLNLSRWVPGLAVGGGFDLVPASVYLKRDVPLPDGFGTSRLSGSSFGVGGHGGVVYRLPALKKLSIGATYRSGVRLAIDGTADFDSSPVFRDLLPPDGDAFTTITLPQVAAVGVAFRPFDFLLVELDGNWIGWSSYHKLAIEFQNGTTTVQDKDWHNTGVGRLGLEVTWRDFIFRGGYAFDVTPIPAHTLDFSLPDHNRNVVTVGASYALPAHLSVDAGILWVIPDSKTTSSRPNEPPIKGEFHSSAWLFALGLRWDLEQFGAIVGQEEKTAAADLR